MFALVIDEHLAAMNQLLVKILKNRYGDVNMKNQQTGSNMSRFVVGIDRSKMKLYDLTDKAQEGLDNNIAISPPAPTLLNESVDLFANLEDEDENTASPKLKSAPPVFDIDEPFSEAIEDAERRRSITKLEKADYKPQHVTKKVLQFPKKLNV